MNRGKKIYALYEGERNICDGTLYEISKKTGMAMKTLLWMTRPSVRGVAQIGFQ